VRTRIVGSLLVVVVSLIPLLMGGPVFSLFMVILGVVGYREYLALVAEVHPTGARSQSLVGYTIVAALGFAALVSARATSILFIVFLAVAAPLTVLFPRPVKPGDFPGWTLVSTGSLYLGLPIYAAVATRSSSGAIDAPWLAEAARRFAFDWDPAPRGLAWVLTVVLAIWVGDSTAFLIGRVLGKTKLAPIISPNKSREGAIAGLMASMAVGSVSFLAFGLADWWMGMIAGAVMGLAGQIGDLAESLLKRQAGVKDSGSIVPGHGGVLDRIDALLFAFPVGFLMTAGLGGFGT
jgi:phosphatidate cytidylyltransferase